MMSKKSKNNRILSATIAIFFILVIIRFIVIMSTAFSPAISKDQMQKEFAKHKDIIINVTEYLKDQKYTYIGLSETDKKGEMFVLKNYMEMGSYISIRDETIAKDIDDLFGKYKYTNIDKRGNAIYFQRWVNLRRRSGIAYSLDGLPPQDEMTLIEPLNEEKWYYYEGD